MDGDVLADGVARSEDDFAFDLRLETEILGICANDRSTADGTLFAHFDTADDLRMCLDTATRGYFSGAINDDIGTDLDAGIKLRRGMNDRGGMDHVLYALTTHAQGSAPSDLLHSQAWSIYERPPSQPVWRHREDLYGR